MDIGISGYAPLIKMINDGVEKKVNNELKEYGITFSQIRVIVLLYHSKDKIFSLKELEKIFHVSQQAIAGIVKRLEYKKLLEGFTDQYDKRIKKVRLTPKGEIVGQKAERKIAENSEFLSQCLDEEEQSTLIKLLDKVQDYMSSQDGRSIFEKKR